MLDSKPYTILHYVIHSMDRTVEIQTRAHKKNSTYASYIQQNTNLATIT